MPCPRVEEGGTVPPVWRRGTLFPHIRVVGGAAHSPGASHQLTRRTHDGGTLMTPPVTSQRPHLQIPAP